MNYAVDHNNPTKEELIKFLRDFEKRQRCSPMNKGKYTPFLLMISGCADYIEGEKQPLITGKYASFHERLEQKIEKNRTDQTDCDSHIACFVNGGRSDSPEI